MAGKRLSRGGIVGVLVALGLLLSVTPALAATANGSFTATCDPIGYDYSSGASYYHDKYGTITVKQTSDNPAPSHLPSTVRLKSQNGTVTYGANIGKGQSNPWPNLSAAYWQVQAKLSGQDECNGILPGHGNYAFAYTITY